MTKSTNFCETIHKIIQNIFFTSVKKNAKDSFCVFGEAHESPLNTIKLSWQNVFFVHAYEKKISHHFKKNSQKCGGII